MLILLIIGGVKACSDPYFHIAYGCYKIVNGSHETWLQARQSCANDEVQFGNGTAVGGRSHLLALENYMERNAVTRYMRGEDFSDDIFLLENATVFFSRIQTRR